MTTVTWAWKHVVNGPDPDWEVAKNWSTGALPGPDDDVVIPADSEPCSAVTTSGIDIQSLDVGGHLGIFGGQFSVSGGVTIENGGGLGIDNSNINNGPVTFSVAGTFTNDGGVVFGQMSTVSIATFDDAATGSGDMLGQVTIGNATIAYNGSADVSMGADCNGGDHGGNLKVTGTLDLTGRFVVGNSTPNSGTSSEAMSADDLVVAATGRFVAVDSSVTLGDVSNSGTNAESGLTGFFVDADNPATGSVVHITGTFDNIGGAVVGGTSGGASTVTIGTLTNEADGAFGVFDAAVTIGNVTNLGANTGSTAAGLGVDYPQGADDFISGGSLSVTGTFTNAGDFGVGDVSSTGVIGQTTVDIATFDNQSTGGVNIFAGQVTIGTLDNQGASTSARVHAGFGLDNLPGLSGVKLGAALLSKLIVTTLDNTGDFVMGNSGMTGSVVAQVGTLDNAATGNIVLTAGQALSSVQMQLAATPSNWTGNLELAGGTSEIAGTASLVMQDNGQISSIASGNGIQLLGDQAYIADADDETANSALQGLTTINGTLDLEFGAEVTVKGNLTNNSGTAKQAGIAIDFQQTTASSILTVQQTLTNNGFIAVGNLPTSGTGLTELSVGALGNNASGGIGIIGVAAEVTGDLTNAGVGTGNGIGVDIVQGAEGGSLTVGGAATNSGELGIGNSGDDGSTKASFNSLQNAATGSIAIVNAKVAVTNGLTNLGGGANGGIIDGIGVDLANGSSGSLTVGGVLTNSGDIGIGNASNNQSTFASFGSLDNASTGSLGIEGAGVTVTGAAQNAGVGAANGFDDGISVDIVNGTSNGTFDVEGTFTNNGVFAAGNLDDQLSTLVTFGALVNGASGSMQLIDAEATVSGTASNAGTGKGHGIFVGGQTGSDQTSLDVIGAFTNSGELVVGNGLGTASVTASGFTNTGAVEIDLAASIVLQTNTVYTQSGGAGSTTDVAGALTAFQVNLTGGVLEGDGTIASLVSNTGGNLLAGSSVTTPGVLTIGGTAPGSYSQGAKGKMTELIAGATAGQSGEVKVSGKVSLAGTLVIQAISGFAFAAGQTFEIMSFAANGLTGLFSAIDFGSVVGNAHDALIGNGLALVADYESKQGQVDLDVVDTTVSTTTFASEESILNQITQGFDIQDTAANIAAHFTALAADAAHIDAVALIGPGTHTLDLTEAEFKSGGALLKEIAAPYVLNVADGSTTTTTGFGNDLKIAAAATGNDTITAAGSGDQISLTSGTGDTITGAGFTVTAANGTGLTVGGNGVSGAMDVVDGSDATVAIEGSSRVTANGSSDTITVGAGSHLAVYGSTDVIAATTGDGIWIDAGTGDTITGAGFTVYAASGTGFTVEGTGDVVYAGLNDALTDDGSSDTFKVDSNVGSLKISGFGSDPTGIVDLLNGVGGYTTPKAAFHALTSDGSGGSLLSLGTDGSIDLLGVAPGALQVTNFQVG